MTRPRHVTDRGERYAVKVFKPALATWCVVELTDHLPVANSLARTWRTHPEVSMTQVEDRGEQERCDVCGLPVDRRADACPHCG